MSALIFYIFLIFIVVTISKANKAGKKSNYDKQYQELQKRYDQKRASQVQTLSAQPSQKTVSPRQEIKQSGHGVKQAGQAVKQPVQETKSKVQKTSTTDYLQKKARMDQIEHAKEKREEMERVNQKYGGNEVGGRYLLGDPIPRGMKIKYCPYCGAENLVPDHYYSGKDCYFCRTELK
ncbi:MAG: hypothetical protein J6A11_11245 [Lachnospiraceae bacterium]|nr:hypothetical protein [Lachnospiraceae bacterium]